MPLLDGIAGLDSAHRAQQVRYQAAAAGGVVRLFSGLTIEDVLAPESPRVDAWLRSSTNLILQAQERSAATSRDYYDGVRALVTGDRRKIEHAEREPEAVERLRTGLFVTGIVTPRQKIAALAAPPTVDDPLRQRQVESIFAGQQREALAAGAEAAAGAAAKFAADGGREQVKADVRSDRKALGWIRVTRGIGTCFFCAMLASRGPVYAEDSFDESDARFEGPGKHKVHDNCSCSLRVVFTRSSAEIPQWNFDQIDAWRSLSDRLDREEGRSPTIADWRADYASRTRAA